MKFLHLSDLHIGLRLLGRDLREDQEWILSEIVREAGREQPDAVVIAGDLYDKAVPSAEAVEVFDGFVSGLAEACPQAELMMISGNHDSASRIDLFRQVLRSHRIHMIGKPPQKPEEYIECVTLEDGYGPVHFRLLPFVRPSMVREIVGVRENGNPLSYDESLRRLLAREEIDRSARNVLVSHQFYLPVGADPESVERMDSEIVSVGNLDAVRADVLEPFDYAALGHIHKPMRVGSETRRYCGTPFACSVSEAGQRKGILAVELREKGNVLVRTIPLTPLREVRVVRGPLAEVLAQGSEDLVTVVLTDPVEWDVLDMQDRVRNAFPNLLEIRRELPGREDAGDALPAEPELDIFTQCCQFLGETDEETRALLREVIDTVREVG